MPADASTLVAEYKIKHEHITKQLQRLTDDEPVPVDLTDRTTIGTTQFMRVMKESMNIIKKQADKDSSQVTYPTYVLLIDFLIAIDIAIMDPNGLVSKEALTIMISHAKQLIGSRKDFVDGLTYARLRYPIDQQRFMTLTPREEEKDGKRCWRKVALLMIGWWKRVGRTSLREQEKTIEVA
ncbi:MAG: hypothetical protein M1828_007015 [Chrysothrix sp. TS-e1954]|nr:MAG: hypothetical protein M1828_007015 [Chrysothrix sp. TS-e1954]